MGVSTTLGALLLRGADVYAPAPLGRRDILVVGHHVVRMDKRISPSEIPLPGLTTLSARGRLAVPGLVDAHVHVAGAGGEGGFGNRTPPCRVEDLTSGGTTTFVGLLGTDSITRSAIELLAEVRRLRAQGLSGYMYTGAYWMPGSTLTDTVRLDMVLVGEVLGAGELAVSDTRGAAPPPAEIASYAREVRLGALLAGKRGVLHIHMGDEDTGLEPVMEAVNRSRLPIGIFHPTHLNRNAALLAATPAFAREGGNVDITAGIRPDPPVDRAPIEPAKALARLLADGVPEHQLTMSSDGCGSSPVFDEEGRLKKLDMVSPRVLLEAFRRLVQEERVDLATALRIVTENPARGLGLRHKGTLAPGCDADVVLLDQALLPRTVVGGGRLLMQDGETLVQDPFQGP